MWYQIGVIVVAIFFLIYLVAAFGTSVGALLLNGAIIFLIVYRSYFEIKARGYHSHLIGALLAGALLLLIGNFGEPFWWITTFTIIAYVVSILATALRKKKVINVSRFRMTKHKA